jgi:hypothetical protein
MARVPGVPAHRITGDAEADREIELGNLEGFGKFERIE